MEIIEFVFFFIVSALALALMFYLGNRIDFLEDKISGQADRLSKELFTDYGCITEQFGACLSKIDSAQKGISLEIACLATKNNEDIKRMGGKFEEWDLIEVEGKEFVIVKNYTNSNGDSMVSCMGNNGQTYNYYKERLADAKFIKHIESPFEWR